MLTYTHTHTHTSERGRKLGGDAYVFYLDCDHGFLGVRPNSSNGINEKCTASLYSNYNLVKLFFSIYKEIQNKTLVLKYWSLKYFQTYWKETRMIQRTPVHYKSTMSFKVPFQSNPLS